MNFPAHIKQQHEVVGRFINILDREQATLTAAPIDTELLSELAKEKAVCAAELETLEQTRQKILTDNGHATDLASAEKLARATGCAQLWGAFVGRVAQARARNDMNGSLISQRLDYNEQALTLLNDISGGGLYGPDGQTSSGKYLHRSV